MATIAASIAAATAADATCEPTGSCGPRRERERTGAGSYNLDVSPVNRTDRNRDAQRDTQ